VNDLPRVVTQLCADRGSNARPLDRKSDAVPLYYHATLSLVEEQAPGPAGRPTAELDCDIGPLTKLRRQRRGRPAGQSPASVGSRDVT